MKVSHLLRSIQYALLTAVGWVLTPVIRLIFSLVYRSSSKCVAPIEDPLCLLPATELARKIRAREVTFKQSSMVQNYCLKHQCDVTLKLSQTKHGRSELSLQHQWEVTLFAR